MPSPIQQATASKAVEKSTAAQHAVELRRSIEINEAEFAKALPAHVDASRFLRASLTALSTVKHLNECSKVSVLAGLMQAAQLGLEVADVRGQCFLIPRKNRGVYEATFQLGYRGLIDLAARGGIVVQPDIICEHDVFDFARGTKAFLHHRPTLADRGNPIGYYAVATFADGRAPVFAIMGLSEVEKHRDQFASSRDYNTKEIKGPWVDNFDSMAKKTVIRQLLNYLPATVELRQAEAIEATSTDLGAISHGASFQQPEGIDAYTGELDTPDHTLEAQATEVTA